MNNPKVWMVRYHMNRLAAFPYRDVYVVACTREHALTVAAMKHLLPDADWDHVKRATASVASWLAPKDIHEASGKLIGPPLVHEG